MTQPANENAPSRFPAWVRPVLEFSPLVLFFVVQRATRSMDDLGGPYWATITLMITTTISVTVSRVIEKRWPPVALITGIVVGVMGGLTIYLNSEVFIKIKPTLINAILGLILLGGLIKGKLFLQNVLGSALPMREEGWKILTKRMVFYFFALAVGNEILRRSLNTDDWTTVKTFGFGPAWLLFLLAQGSLFDKFSSEESQSDSDTDPE